MGKFPGKISKSANKKRVKANDLPALENEAAKAAEDIYNGLNLFYETFGKEDEKVKEFRGFTKEEVCESISLANRFYKRRLLGQAQLSKDEYSFKFKTELEDVGVNFFTSGEDVATTTRHCFDGGGKLMKQKSELNFCDNKRKSTQMKNDVAKRLLRKAKKSTCATVLDHSLNDRGTSGVARKFVLPSRSAHSSRVIKPNKRFIDNDDPMGDNCAGINQSLVHLKRPRLLVSPSKPVLNNYCLSEQYNCDYLTNSSKYIGNCNAKSMGPNSSLFENIPENIPVQLNERVSKNSNSLVIEGKRRWKPSYKVKLELSELNYFGAGTSDFPYCGIESSPFIKADSCTNTREKDHSQICHVNKVKYESQSTNCSEEKCSTSSPMSSGKVILRQARLKLNTQNTSVVDGPFSVGYGCGGSLIPGTVECGVCGAVRFYKFVKQARKFGIYSCESCRKFVSKLIKRQSLGKGSGHPMTLECHQGKGMCLVPPIVRSQQWKAGRGTLVRCNYKARCPACWLKKCLRSYKMPQETHAHLLKLLPAYIQTELESFSGSAQAQFPDDTLFNAPSLFIKSRRQELSQRLSFGHTMKQLDISTKKPVLKNSELFSQSKSPGTYDKFKVGKKLNSRSARASNMRTARIVKRATKNLVKLKDDSYVEISTNKRKRQNSAFKRRKKLKLDEKICDEKAQKRQKMDMKGPRVKHVCRSASIVLGQQQATFPLKKDGKQIKTKKAMSLKDGWKTARKYSGENIPSRYPECKSTQIQNDSNDNTKNPPELGASGLQDDCIANIVAPNQKSARLPTTIQSKPSTLFASGKTNIDKPPHQVSIDFWESYDPDEVCNSGFGLIGSEPFQVRAMCFLCGSAGHEQLIHCASCCEPYHKFCLEDGMRDPNIKAFGGAWVSNWVCQRCTVCCVCGNGKGQQLSCHRCHRTFHTECLSSRRLYSPDRPWVCSSCLQCKSCSDTNVTVFVGNLPLCKTCFNLRQKGNYCPLCQRCYDDNDYDTMMMECGKCKCWVHAKCEGLSDEKYHILSSLPESVEFVCRMCCTVQPAPWWSAVEAELKAGCLGVLKLLSKNRNLYGMLKSSPSKRCSITSPLDSLLSHKTEEPVSPKAHDRIESLLCLSDVQSGENYETNDKLLLITQGDSVNVTDVTNTVKKLDSPNYSLKDKNVSSVSPEDSVANSDVPYDVWREKYNLKECSVRVKDCVSGDAERTLIPVNVEIQCLDLAETTCAGDQKLSYKSQPLSTPKSDSGISSTDEELKTADDTKERNLEFQSLQLISCGDKNNVMEQASIGEKSEIQQISSDETPHKPTVTLLSIKNKVNANEYTTLVQFHNEMENVLNTLNCSDLLNMYHHNLQEVFPWFNAKCARASDKPLHEDKMQVKRSKKLSDKPVNKDNLSTDVSILDESFQKFPVDMSSKSLDDFYSGYTVEDKRICILCKGIGDGIPSEEGRLLYCGQNEWTHTNCALWSAEVFEEIDGSLQNVHSAVSRGRQMRCEHCGKRGASVGCCAKNCPESYHFSCARKAKCTFMDDKNVYCPTHTKEAKGKVLQEDTEFDIRRPIYVELDRKKKKYTDPQKVRLMIGSFSLENIGTYVNEISDTVDAIIPNDFHCTRLFWSTVEPWRIVQYHIKTTLHTENSKDSHDYGKNFTIDHSLGKEVVEQKMNEILLWQKELNLKQYGPSKDFTSSQSYSVAKVKHVMSIVDSKHTLPFLSSENTVEYLNKIVRQVLNDIVDTICSKEPDESCLSDSQTANDLLPPELKDAIFEDLPHDLLDGISMQDILPKLMIYEDMVSLDRGDGYFFSDVSKDEREANAAILNCETEVSVKTSTDSSKMEKNDDENSQNSLWNQFNKIDSDNSIEKCNPFRGKRRELKRSKSEVFTDVFSPSVSTCSRKPKRSCSLTWNCKLDAAISSTYKRRKARTGSKHVGEGASNIVMVVDANSDKAHMLQELSLPVSMSRSSTSGISPAPVETVRDLKSRLDDDCGVGDARKRSSHPKEEGKENKCLVWHSRSQPRILQLDGTVDSLSSSGSEGGSSPHSADERSMCAACKGKLNSINSMGLCSTCCSKTAVFIKCNDKKLKQDVEEEPVRCDRCHCTYRTRVSFERHLPMCSSDYILSTSESDSENTRSSEEDCSKGTNFTILNQSDTKVQHTVETQTISKSIQTLSVHTQTQVQTSTVSFRPRNRSISKVMTHRNVSRNNVTISNNQTSQYNQIHHLPTNTHPNQTQNAPTIIIQQVPSANVVPTFVEAFQQQTGQSLQFIATIDSQPNDVHEQAFITGQATNPVMSTFHLQSSTDNLSGLRNGGISVVPSVQITTPQPTLPILGIINAQPQPNGLDCCCDLVSTEQILPSFNMYENHSRGLYYPSHQPFYVSNYETVVSNTVMSSSHLVSGPVSGMVAASSSISSTTTQVFQASKVPSILEYEIVQPSTYNYVVNQPQFTNATVRNTEIFVNNPASTNNGTSGVQKFPSQQTVSTNNRHKCFTLETVNTDHTYTHGNSETYIAVYPNATKPSINVDKSYRSVSLETDECIQSRVKDVTTQTELASKINGHIFPAESKSHMVTSNVNPRNKIQTVSIKNGQNSLDALTKKTQITLPVTNGINNSNPQSPLKLVFQKQARDGIYKISSHNGAVKLVNAKRIVSLPISSVPVKSVSLQKCDISSSDDLAVEKPKTMPTDISHTKILKNCENEVKLISKQTSYEQIPNQEHEIRKSHPHLTYEIQSQDGFTCSSTSFSDAWQQVFKAVQKARGTNKMVPVPQNAFNGKQESLQMLGLKHNAFRYLVEQLPGVNRCIKYKLRYHKRHDLQSDDDDDFNLYIQPNRTGCARTEKFLTRAAYDMFSWLASAHRNPPKFIQQAEGEVVGNRRATSSNLPMAMRFRHLKGTNPNKAVGVYRSHIHGRGLFCLRDIESGEMVIEYAGEVIRSTLTDKREKLYESKGIGCYMFRIDDQLVVDATMRGNAARFINHSCDPNCYSRVVDILGKKHILIFALRRIPQGEELTYDYKFPFEDVKIPCTCGSRKCRKYLN